MKNDRKVALVAVSHKRILAFSICSHVGLVFNKRLPAAYK